jgi:hypothetical protein
MAPLAEEVASELEVTGGSAWGKLHGTVTSQLIVPIEIAGELQSLPMSVIRNLAHEPDRQLRRRAYEAELKGWESVAVPLAAALNSIKGESNTLAARRNWGEVVDIALFQNNIDRPTLDAMMEAATASFPDFRRYLRAKRTLSPCRLLPGMTSSPRWGNPDCLGLRGGHTVLLEQFGSYSPTQRVCGPRLWRELDRCRAARRQARRRLLHVAAQG